MKKRNELFERLRNILDQSAADVYIEAALSQAGLLKELEERGVLPTVENPNPFDPVIEIDAHDRWWRDRPEAARKFQGDMEYRECVLRQIYMGTQLTR